MVIYQCRDCGDGWKLGQLQKYTDRFGASTYQCPQCYAVVFRTPQGTT